MTNGARSTRPQPDRLRATGQLARFTALVALFAILSDAAVGHALWADYTGGADKKSHGHLIGSVVLVILLGVALVAGRSAPNTERRRA